jgi:hypothetical protein
MGQIVADVPSGLSLTPPQEFAKYLSEGKIFQRKLVRRTRTRVVCPIHVFPESNKVQDDYIKECERSRILTPSYTSQLVRLISFLKGNKS